MSACTTPRPRAARPVHQRPPCAWSRRRFAAIVGLAALGCDRAAGPASAATLATALAEVQRRPRAAVAICAPVRDPRWHADCLLSAVERLAAREPAEAEALCDAITDPLSVEECWFQVAERTRDPSGCSRAGRFADDCRMHLFVAGLPRWAPARPADGPLEGEAGAAWAAAVEAAVPEHQREVGFGADDTRPWFALFRHLHATEKAPNPSICAPFWGGPRAEPCVAAGVGVYQDRLRYARDTGDLSCAAERARADALPAGPWRQAFDAVLAADCPREVGP